MGAVEHVERGQLLRELVQAVAGDCHDGVDDRVLRVPESPVGRAGVAERCRLPRCPVDQTRERGEVGGHLRVVGEQLDAGSGQRQADPYDVHVGGVASAVGLTCRGEVLVPVLDVLVDGNLPEHPGKPPAGRLRVGR